MYKMLILYIFVKRITGINEKINSILYIIYNFLLSLIPITRKAVICKFQRYSCYTIVTWLDMQNKLFTLFIMTPYYLNLNFSPASNHLTSWYRMFHSFSNSEWNNTRVITTILSIHWFLLSWRIDFKASLSSSGFYLDYETEVFVSLNLMKVIITNSSF